MNFLGTQNGSAGPKKSWAFWGPPRGASSSAAPPANAAVLMALGYGEANNGGTAHAAAFPFFCEGHCQSAMHAAGAMRVSVKRDPNSAGTYSNTHEWANWCEQCYVMLTNAAREFEMVRLSRLPHRRAAAVCRAATDLRSVQADKNDVGVGLAAGLPTTAADAGAGASIIAPIAAAGAAASNYISAAAAGWGTAAGFDFADGDLHHHRQRRLRDQPLPADLLRDHGAGASCERHGAHPRRAGGAHRQRSSAARSAGAPWRAP